MAAPLGPKDLAVLSLCFVACTISAAFSLLLLAAIPALLALRRAALAVEQLAVTAKEELPGTMAAVRLSGMEISDLTMELSDLSQEITEGVRTSARAVKAAEDGLKRRRSYAQSKTVEALKERADLPVPGVGVTMGGGRSLQRTQREGQQKKESFGTSYSASGTSMLLGLWQQVPFVGGRS